MLTGDRGRDRSLLELLLTSIVPVIHVGVRYCGVSKYFKVFKFYHVLVRSFGLVVG